MPDSNPFAPLPVAFARPRYPRSSAMHARVAIALLIGAACCRGIEAVLVEWRMFLLEAGPATASDYARLAAIVAAAGYAAWPATVFAWSGQVALIAWTWRANRVARGLGARDLLYTPAGAVWAHIVPVLSAWRPYQVVAEIWRAAAPELVPGAPTQGGRVGAEVVWWWGMALAAGVIGAGNVLSSLPQARASAPDGRWQLVALGLGFASSLFAARVVRRTSQRQTARAARWADTLDALDAE